MSGSSLSVKRTEADFRTIIDKLYGPIIHNTPNLMKSIEWLIRYFSLGLNCLWPVINSILCVGLLGKNPIGLLGKKPIECYNFIVANEYHRLDGPAKFYVIVDVFQRLPNGNSVWHNGREWYQWGVRHRNLEEGPAVECDNGTKEWWIKGKRAYVYANEFWFLGKKVTIHHP
jgi:hypothetical protein